MDADNNSIQTPMSQSDGGFADFLMSSLFGHGWQNVLSSDSASSYTTALFNAFSTFNSAVMFAVGIILTWVLVTAVAGAAAAGRPLGEGQNTSFWTPTRAAFSVAMLAPIPGVGLSIAQAIVLALVLPSINLANDLSNSVVSTMTGRSMSAQSTQVDQAVLKPLVFNLHTNGVLSAQKQIFELASLSNLNAEKGFIQKLKDDDTGASWGFFTSKSVFAGEFSLHCSKYDVDAGMCDIKKSAYNSAIYKTFDLAFDLMSAHKVMRAGERGRCEAVKRDDLRKDECVAAQLSQVLVDTTFEIGKVAANVANDQNSKIGQFSKEIRDGVADSGFLMIGTYYTRLNKLNSEYNSLLNVSSSYTTQRERLIKSAGYGSGQIKERLEFVDGILRSMPFSGSDSVLQRIDASKVKDETGFLDLFKAHLAGSYASQKMINNLIAGREPILEIQSSGMSVLSGVDATLAAIATLKATALTAKETANDAAAATGDIPIVGGFLRMGATALKTPAVWAVNFLSEYGTYLHAWSSVIFSALALFIFAVTYYLPALPVILWTLAVLGWVILIIEAVVAAPVWIAAHAMPEGQGIAGEHGRKGYIMLLNILLRPSLMVIGFYIGIALVTAFSTFATYMLSAGITSGLSLAANDSSFGGFGGLYSFLFSFVSGLIILGGTLLVIFHKSLNLVTWLPENVINWVGGASQSLGEETDERRVAAIGAYVQQASPSSVNAADSKLQQKREVAGVYSSVSSNENIEKANLPAERKI
jgi:conjugal transfer/type IV secretion protein DotA/TraY